MTPEFNRTVISLVSGYALFLVAIIGILSLFVPSGNNLVNATSDMEVPEYIFDQYFIKGVSLIQFTGNGIEVDLRANQIVHRDRIILDQIVLVSNDEVVIDHLELTITANEQSSLASVPAKVTMDSFPAEFPMHDDGTPGTLTRVLVDKFSATYTFPQQTQLWIQSETARLYDGIYIFEGGVTINSSQGDRFITRLAVWDKHVGGFLMPNGYRNHLEITDSDAFIALKDDGTLLVTDYFPKSNWESVDIIDLMSQKLANQIIESMGMFFMKVGNQ
jgi:hypothetical protein